MQRFGLPDLLQAHHEVGFCVRNIRHPACTVQQAGEMYASLSEARRAVGVLELLCNADEAALLSQLVHSGYARRHFLARAAAERFADHHVCASNADALFDAIAAGNLELAREIAALSAKAFRPNEEYEEDFCYAHFLHGYISAASSMALRSTLDHFERALDGSCSARLDVCKALFGRDADAFAEAFEALLDEHDDVVEHLRLARAEEEVVAALATYVFVEGLALIRLAERAGLPTMPEYRYCPAYARTTAVQPAPPDELPPV